MPGGPGRAKSRPPPGPRVRLAFGHLVLEELVYLDQPPHERDLLVPVHPAEVRRRGVFHRVARQALRELVDDLRQRIVVPEREVGADPEAQGEVAEQPDDQPGQVLGLRRRD